MKTVVMSRPLVAKLNVRVITLSAITRSAFSSHGFVTELMIVATIQTKITDTPVDLHIMTVPAVSGCVPT